ncbi:MAG: ribosome biogenesis factor YjgA [Candidatus Thiodiazotropha sp.]
MDTRDDDLDPEWDEGPSKSERKREMQALQKLGERLTGLSEGYLSRMVLSEEMKLALAEAKRIKSLNALRRHYRRLGKLLRNEDLASIQLVVDEVDGEHQSSVSRFHVLERWRERLLEGDSEVFGEYLEAYPNADRQQLRQLIQAAQKERDKDAPPAAYRKLFKYLRQVAEL